MNVRNGESHTCVDVHGDVGQVQLLQSVVDALEVGALGIGAFLDVEVGHQVGQAIRFCNMSERRIATEIYAYAYR
jgi:hypothetical protein